MLKEELRQWVRQQKRHFTPTQLEELSLPIIQRLSARLEHAQVIMAYYSLPDEVDTHRLLDDLVRAGKTVLLPKVVGDAEMELRYYRSSSDLLEGAFHIMEPVGDRFDEMEKIDVALVPGMAFDSEGHRLGRGKGYYDRFLSQYHVPTIGICFDFQKVAEVPADV